MLQFNGLLVPISEAMPSGVDLTFSVEVDAINKARQFDDPSLDQGEWITTLKEADWGLVYDKCLVLLTTQTKDLRLLGWLVEAAAKTRQFDGMAAGFEVMSQLCKDYWDTIHPQMEGADADRRVGNLAWLSARAIQLVKEVPLTEGRETTFSWNDFETARARVNSAARTGEELIDSAAQPALAVLESARRKSSKEFYAQLIEGAARCKSTVIDLEQVLDARLGMQGPSFTSLKDVLENVLVTIERFGSEVGLKTLVNQNPEAAVADHDNAASLSDASVPGRGGPIKNRDQALEQLRLVAEFFRRTEPHSPVAYLADKAAAWGDLSLHTWLKSVVKDPNSLASIEEMLGINSGNSVNSAGTS
jgi:type VI secretion system protein ImpA